MSENITEVVISITNTMSLDMVFLVLGMVIIGVSIFLRGYLIYIIGVITWMGFLITGGLGNDYARAIGAIALIYCLIAMVYKGRKK